MKLGILLALVLLVGCVSASSVTCVIVDDKVLVDIRLSDGAEVIFPEEYSLLETDGDKVSFVSKDFIRYDGEWIFIFPMIINDTYDLEIVLPSGFILSDGLIYPKSYDIGSDGKNIILSWENVDEEVIVFYEGVKSSYFLVFVLLGILILLGFLFFRFQKIKFARELERLKKHVENKKKKSGETLITKNLFGEEKRIVEFLIVRKSSWMKDLVRELGISKVMVSRKVRSLIEKGLVEKENFGRENKIRLVRKKVS